MDINFGELTLAITAISGLILGIYNNILQSRRDKAAADAAADAAKAAAADVANTAELKADDATFNRMITLINTLTTQMNNQQAQMTILEEVNTKKTQQINDLQQVVFDREGKLLRMQMSINELKNQSTTKDMMFLDDDLQEGEEKVGGGVLDFLVTLPKNNKKKSPKRPSASDIQRRYPEVNINPTEMSVLGAIGRIQSDILEAKKIDEP